MPYICKEIVQCSKASNSFTSTTVHALTQKEVQHVPYICKEIVPSFEDNPIGAHFTCFTSTNIHTNTEKPTEPSSRRTGEER